MKRRSTLPAFVRTRSGTGGLGSSFRWRQSKG